MTGVQIKQEAEAYIDEFIDDRDAVIAINRALNLIGDMAQVYESVKAKIDEPGVWYELPPTVTHVQEVERVGGGFYPYFRTRDNMILFEHPGVYIIHYKRLPNPISGIMETPEIHPAFHQVLVTYVIAWWKLKDDDENPDGLRHYQLFFEDTLRVFNTLRRQRGRKTWRVER